TALTGACFQIGLWYFLTYRMQTQFGYSPIQAGLAFLPLTASMLVVNLWFTPRLMKRHAPRALIASGVVAAVPGRLGPSVADGGSCAVAVLVRATMSGIGGGSMNTPPARPVTTGVRAEHPGAASGLMNTATQSGAAIGRAAATAAAAISG